MAFATPEHGFGKSVTGALSASVGKEVTVEHVDWGHLNETKGVLLRVQGAESVLLRVEEVGGKTSEKPISFNGTNVSIRRVLVDGEAVYDNSANVHEVAKEEPHKEEGSPKRKLFGVRRG